jgi:hypothetical protein
LLNKELLGIYLEKDRLQYAFIRKGILGLTPSAPFPGMEPFGEITGSAYSSLKIFLKKISDRNRYNIYLALPRDLFFVREARLPSMMTEDALVSVQNSLSMYCHLLLDEIYYDIHLSRLRDGINALIFYAPRRKIDPYLAVFRETGMKRFLKALFPLSFGIHAWLDIQRYSYPLGLILPTEDKGSEIALYGKEGFLYSAICPPSEGNSDEVSFLANVSAGTESLEGRIFYLNPSGEPVLSPPLKNRLGRVPLITQNMGIAALSPALFGKQEISLDGTPTRLKQFQPAKVVIPLFLALFLGLSFLTWHVNKQTSLKSEQLLVLKEQVRQLKKQIEPLRKDLELLEKSSQFIKDIDDYMASRPKLYTTINKLAELVPEGTWFSYFSFKKGRITLKGTGGDALKVVERLRKSGLFDQVKLMGSVSRTGEGKEKFGLNLKVKEVGDQENPSS